MTVITFDDNLITGNKTIDEQHKELIDRIQQFVSACESEDARVKAIKMLDYLDEYTEFHFKEEEKLQKDVGYPGLEEHIKKHEEFRHTVKVLYDYLDENEGPDEKFMEQVKINVIDWLFGHIKTFDRSVAEYINIYIYIFGYRSVKCLDMTKQPVNNIDFYLFHKLFIWSLIFIQIVIEYLNSMPELLMLLYMFLQAWVTYIFLQFFFFFEMKFRIFIKIIKHFNCLYSCIF